MEEQHLKATVSAILPARNEETNIAEAVASLDAQPELAEIIVVDDGSADATPAILEELRARMSRLRVMEGGELPAGWTGKNHAAAVGAGAAPEESRWLLFTDADTRHEAGSLGKALQKARDEKATLVSYSPEQVLGSLGERALIPVVYCRLARKFSFERVNNPALADAAANGQYMLLRRDAYLAVGGHAAIRGQILDDVELARRLKAAGYRIWFGPGQGIAKTRMYRSFSGMWDGWTKNLYLLFGESAGAMAAEFAPTMKIVLAIAFLSALLLPGGGPARWIAAFVGVLLGVVAHAKQALQLRRNRYPARLIEYYALGELLFGAALARSWWRNTRGAVSWKGRTYPAGTR